MFINVNKLRGKITEKGTTQDAVANSIGMARSTFYRKMKAGGLGFTVNEIYEMVRAIPLTKQEMMDIFFNDEVA